MPSLSQQQLTQLVDLEKWLQVSQQPAPPKQWSGLSNTEQKHPNPQPTPDVSEPPLSSTDKAHLNSSSCAHILGGRTQQEDAIHRLEEHLPHDGGRYHMEAVYDGHAGNDVSKWMETHALPSIHQQIYEHLHQNIVPLNGHRLANVLQKVQEKWLQDMPITLRGGCTTTILFQFYELNATASLIVGDGRVYMYDKNGNIPVLEQSVFDGEIFYHHHNSHRTTQPCLTRLQVFTGPIFAKNGEPLDVGTPVEFVNFDDYYSSVSEQEFLEWKTYLLSEYANPQQILQFPENVKGNSWRIPDRVEPTRSNAPNPKSGGEIAMRFGEVTWTDLPADKTLNDYSFVVACDGLEDLGALNPQIIGNLLCDHELEFQNYYTDHRFLGHSSLQTAFSFYEKTHPRPPPLSPLSKKLDWVLSSANGLGPLCRILDAQWIRSIQEARDFFYDYEQGKKIGKAKMIAQYAGARFSSDNISLWVTH
tara:strand:- start:1452 stop:2876 length:1425 start_codon:yes stop_codon:yes gene_type:complete